MFTSIFFWKANHNSLMFWLQHAPYENRVYYGFFPSFCMCFLNTCWVGLMHQSPRAAAALFAHTPIWFACSLWNAQLSHPRVDEGHLGKHFSDSFSRSLGLLLLKKIISKFDWENYLFYGRALVAEPLLSLSGKGGTQLVHTLEGSCWIVLLQNRLPREKEDCSWVYTDEK